MASRLSFDDLDALLSLLRSEGRRIIGPTIRDEAIVYDDISSVADLPAGWGDEQAPGHYRLRKRDDEARFGHVVGPHSWKRFLFPARETLVRIRRKDERPEWSSVADEGPPLVFLGVRSCDLAAIEVQDRVFVRGPFVDGRYRARRDQCLIIAVNCIEAGQLCFCDSMDTGPRVRGDYDLCLTELGDALVVEAGSEAGRALLDRLAPLAADVELVAAADEAIERCRASMGRTLVASGLPARLMGNLAHEQWNDVAARCLACGNCTSVCPTCFCSNISDHSTLGADEAWRERAWDSCFTSDHSTIHGAQFRPDIRSRYQQWLTHKLATWTSQFGTSGCVGCGRCIAWCPAGIDMTVEASTIASGPGQDLPLPEPSTHVRHDGDALVPTAVEVHEVVRETHDTVTLVLSAPPGYAHQHGQFNMLSLPAVGEVPISVSGFEDGVIEHTLRAVGNVTNALAELRPGAVLGLRGPYGTAWPLERCVGRPVVVVAGGIGLAPLRGAIREMVRRPDDYPSLRVLYGTRSPGDILFDRELLGWIQSRQMRAHVTVDRGDRSWTGNIGVVTKLMRRKKMPEDGVYLLCGPEIMMRYSLSELGALGVPDESIYLSMERNMKCAIGHCGRCQYGPHFICKDGPVFRYDQVKDIFAKPGF